MRRSPKHAITPFKGTAATDFGTMAHAYLLEPHTMLERYLVGPCDDRRLKKWKEWAAEHDGEGVEYMRPSDLVALKAMRQAVVSKSKAAELLNTPGPTEVSVVWIDAETGLLCKARPDKLIPDKGICIDLKTTADASEDAFSRTVYRFGYHMGASFYLDGLRANGVQCGRFLLLAVESGEPHEAAVYELDEDWMLLGEEECRKMLALYAECKKANNWPGYEDKIQRIGPAPWLMNKVELELEFGESTINF
jgi:exodeoxyribonuclease VIII